MSQASKPHQPELSKVFVAVAGNIGAGKSSLTELLAKYYGWQPYYEVVTDNPYLKDFYADMSRWSFNLQVFFLSSRFQHQQKIIESRESVIQDRTIYEDAEIFARNLHDMGFMDTRDYKNYTELYSVMTSYLKPPDLLIYLKCEVSTLVKHIQTRGRDFENKVSIDYLEKLNGHYDDWVSRYALGKKIIVKSDALDFVSNQDDLNQIVALIDGQLYGLF
jgi:deoxyadenosine/deoxycytidine kinase